MAKTATVTKTKTATKAAIDKKTRVTKPKVDKSDKPKREPTAYQVFCKAHMKEWNDANPGRSREAMAQMAKLWKDAPENPNRGAEPKPRKPKAAKEPKEKKPRATKAKKAVEKEEDEEAEGEADEDEDEDEAKKSSSDVAEGSDD